MPRQFIASLAAAAIALTTLSAAPAVAGDRNLERFVIGAGTLLLLSEINKHNKAEQATHRHHGKKRGGPRRLAPLPRYCLTTVRKRGHKVRMFGARCLRNNYRHAGYLPRQCRIQVASWHKGHKIHRTGYRPQCLRRAGFRVAGHR